MSFVMWQCRSVTDLNAEEYFVAVVVLVVVLVSHRDYCLWICRHVLFRPIAISTRTEMTRVSMSKMSAVLVVML